MRLKFAHVLMLLSLVIAGVSTGCSGTDGNQPALTVEISADPLVGTPPLVVHFQAVVLSGSATQYDWDFGDGVTGSGESVDHTYTAQGEYTVTLVATGDGQDVATKNIGITVGEPQPLVVNAVTANPERGVVPLTVGFDVDAEGGVPTLTYSWDFGDGGSSDEKTTTHEFTAVGEYVVTVTVTDLNGATATGQVTVETLTDNAAPTAADVAATTDEDTELEVTLSGSDPDEDELTFEVVEGPSHGVLGTVAGATVVYTPDENFNGEDSFTFLADDGVESSAEATVTITVNPVNDPPTAEDIEEFTPEDESLTLTLTGSDPDDDELTFAIIVQPEHGTVEISDSAPDQATYTPYPDYQGSDSFQYTANDGSEDSAPATVVIAVQGEPDFPRAEDVTAETDEDVAVTIQLIGSDADGTPLTFAITTAPENGNATLVDASTGEVSYTPDPNFNGDDEFTFTVSSGDQASLEATVSVTVLPVNDPPLPNSRTESGEEDEDLLITFTATDVDNPLGPFTFSVSTQPTHGSLSEIAQGAVTYTPDNDFFGEDSFAYHANDGTDSSVEPAVISITITPVNDEPVAVADEASVNEDEVVLVDVLDNDTDIDSQTLTLTGVGAVENAQVDIEDGQVRVTPEANFNGPLTITYTVSDGDGGSDDGVILLTVVPVNDLPVIINANEFAFTPADPADNEDISLSVEPEAFDQDDDHVTFDYQWQHRVDAVFVDVDGASGVQVEADAIGVLSESLTEPRGTYRLVLTPHDGTAYGSSVATGIVTVANTPPTITQECIDLDHPNPLYTNGDLVPQPSVPSTFDLDGDPVTFDYSWQMRAPGLAWSDIDGQDALGANSLPSLPSLLTVRDAEFRLVVRPNDGLSQGIAYYAPCGGPVTVLDSAPIATDDEFSVNEEVSLTVTAAELLANDTDLDPSDTLRIKEVVLRSAGDATLEVTTVGSFVGSIRITGNADFFGELELEYTLVGVDGDGETADDGTDTGTITVNVVNVNDAPFFTSEPITGVNEDSSYVYVATTDDADLPSDSLSVTLTSGPDWLSLVSLGGGSARLSGTPRNDDVGNHEIVLTVTDEDGASVTQEFTIAVANTNDPPVANPDAITSDEDIVFNIPWATLFANDTDVDLTDSAANFTVSALSNAQNCEVSNLTATRAVRFTPAEDFNGTATFQYTVRDTSGA
ncbi:MAG: tandem-95 repeat protein, partial [Myxococcales bacterium]|nr:tandem-95 repeat protein [Myxococcales bacterium]